MRGTRAPRGLGIIRPQDVASRRTVTYKQIFIDRRRISAVTAQCAGRARVFAAFSSFARNAELLVIPLRANLRARNLRIARGMRGGWRRLDNDILDKHTERHRDERIEQDAYQDIVSIIKNEHQAVVDAGAGRAATKSQNIAGHKARCAQISCVGRKCALAYLFSTYRHSSGKQTCVLNSLRTLLSRRAKGAGRSIRRAAANRHRRARTQNRQTRMRAHHMGCALF